MCSEISVHIVIRILFVKYILKKNKYLFEKESYREKNISTCWFIPQSCNDKGGPEESEDLRVSSGWLGPKHLFHYVLLSNAGSWMGSRAAQMRTGSHLGCSICSGLLIQKLFGEILSTINSVFTQQNWLMCQVNGFRVAVTVNILSLPQCFLLLIKDCLQVGDKTRTAKLALIHCLNTFTAKTFMFSTSSCARF